MHIEPGIVAGAKLVLGYATAAAVGACALKLAVQAWREQGIFSFAARSLAATALVFCFFELLPHFRVGVSEVHFILGSTLFLILGAAPTAVGLGLGLLLQGLLFEPADLPQYGMNLTTLLAPLFAIGILAGRIVARDTAYVDLQYRQALTLSTVYQSGIVAWVAFWALYGAGFGAANLGRYRILCSVVPAGDRDRTAGRSGRAGAGKIAARRHGRWIGHSTSP